MRDGDSVGECGVGRFLEAVAALVLVFVGIFTFLLILVIGRVFF